MGSKNSKTKNGLKGLLESQPIPDATKATSVQETKPSGETDVKGNAHQENNTSIEQLSTASTKRPTKKSVAQQTKVAMEQEVETTEKQSVKIASATDAKKVEENEQLVSEPAEEDHPVEAAGNDTLRSGKKESKMSGGQDADGAAKPSKKRKKSEQLEAIIRHEGKNSRVTVENGQSRRPTNVTLLDEYRIALNVLAAKRLIPTWKLLNEAIRRYLVEEGELKE